MKITINIETGKDKIKKEKKVHQPTPSEEPSVPKQEKKHVIILKRLLSALLIFCILTAASVVLWRVAEGVDDLFNKNKTGRAEAEAVGAENYLGYYFIEGWTEAYDTTIEEYICYVSKDYSKLKNGIYDIKCFIISNIESSNGTVEHYSTALCHLIVSDGNYEIDHSFRTEQFHYVKRDLNINNKKIKESKIYFS